MKKILALVLALVMTMSLATISSGAAFSDADSVRYADAVNTLSAYGVLGGYADGSIRPAADVTRGAAAKMVAMVATGSNPTTIGYYKGTSSFADVPATHTFADAVAFCVARGIVAGYGDGNYGVADNVKGWAVAKMVLVAMGYDAKAFGMEGAGSALNTITLASQKGLFAGMKADFAATEAASREECAQIVFNALDVQGVKVKETTSNGVVAYGDSGKCLLNNYSGLGLANYAAVEGLAKADAMEILEAKAAVIITDNQANSTGAYTMAGAQYAVETGLDLIGHKVLMVKSGSGKDAYDNSTYYTVYNVVDLSDVITVSAYENSTIDTEAEFKAKFGANTLTVDTAVDATYTNYADTDGIDATNVFNASSTAKAASGSQKAMNAWEAKAGTYVMYDGKLISYMTSSHSVGYVSDYKAGTAKTDGVVNVANKSGEVINDTVGKLNTKTGNTTPDSVVLYDGIAKGDIVTVQPTGSLYTVTKATTVSGTVSKVVTEYGYESVTVDGKDYSIASTKATDKADVAASGEFNNTNFIADYTAALKEDVTLYLNASGAVIAIVKNSASADAGLFYLVDRYSTTAASGNYGATVTTYYVQGLDTTGKEVSYQVTKAVYDKVGAKKGLAKYDLYNVTTAIATDTNGVKATYATLSSFTDTATANVDNNVATAIKATDVKIGETTNYFASGVKFIFVEGSLDLLKVTVKDGVQAAASGKYDMYATKAATATNWDVQVVFVDGGASTAVASQDVVYASSNNASKLSSATYTKADGSVGSYDVYKVYINGVLTEVKVESENAAGVPNVGFNTYTVDSATGFYSFKDLKAEAANKVMEGKEIGNLYNSLLTVDSLKDVDASAAKIVDVDYAENSWSNTEMVEITDLAGLLKGEGQTKNAVVSVVWTETAGVKTIATIYVDKQPA